MKIAIIGASGKTGTKLVGEALSRGHQVVAVCRAPSVAKLDEFAGADGMSVVAAPQVSDPDVLSQALAGCDAVIAVLISVSGLKASAMVKALAQAAKVNGVKRLVFTAGEITVTAESGETLTGRQRWMGKVFGFISKFTPYSLTDMIEASKLIRQQADWDWTIVRAPTLTEGEAVGYRLCEIDEVTAKHSLSREDYAACLLDSLGNPHNHHRTLTVVSL